MLFVTPVRAQVLAVPRKASLFCVSARYAHDLAITRSGKPLISYGPGGRSSRTGRVVTVFGANGFLGRYLVSKFAREGTIVMVPYREEMQKRFLKVTGDLGVVNFVEFDPRNMTSMEAAIKEADVVYNFIGRDYTTKLYNFHDVNVEIPRRIANTVNKFGVDRLVHISSHDASPYSPSEFLRTKYEGEQVVRDIVPSATIVRPSPVIGQESKIIKDILSFPYLTVNKNQQLIRPIHIHDLTEALFKIGHDDSTVGKTYELFGDHAWQMKDLRLMCEVEAKKSYTEYNVPKKLYATVSDLLNKYLWWPVGCADEVERKTIDQKVDRNALAFADLGMKPAIVQDYIGQYVKHMRADLFMDVPPDSIAERKREREYLHVSR
ncbi:uncharacterized protein V1516DRAFT_645281 [Lipomyces oligophaga]|uniref:uncharacterized protein n=1 Tax=Lipomyces oligophaga TaxID=45792 RepID=UPI0034CFE9C3